MQLLLKEEILQNADLCSASFSAHSSTIMPDRKGRSVVFKTPATVTLKEIQDALTAEIGPDNLTVLQQLPNGDFLIETTSQKLASDIIESGFSLQELHVPCNPPPPPGGTTLMSV